nr:DUF1924 domain-containing protein [uncultured Undibacterium sp.]
MNQIVFLNQFTKPILHCSLSLVLMCSLAISATARAETPQSILKQYEAQSKQTVSPDRGRVLFTTNHGRDWCCDSCHGNPPTQAGKHASTGKSIAPLAPAFNPERFTDVNADAPQDRITKSAWFIRKHDDVSARTWKLAAVKSPSNCIACHQQANLGDFNEHRVHIPR